MVKRGQLKIQQMAFMLIGVVLFFVLVGLLILVIQLSELRQSLGSIEEENALTLAMKIANSPEFSCGESFGGSKLNCIDGDKVMMLKANIEAYENVKGVRGETFWGPSTNIEIEKIFPEYASVECTTQNYPNCNTINLLSEPIEVAPYSNFIILCRKDSKEGSIYNKCDLARLLVTYKDIE